MERLGRQFSMFLQFNSRFSGGRPHIFNLSANLGSLPFLLWWAASGADNNDDSIFPFSLFSPATSKGRS